jgi:hypothetical protein
MRTAIFVYEPTTLAISTTEACIKLVPLENVNGACVNGAEISLQVSNSVYLQPGIYKIVSEQAVTVQPPDGAQVEVMATAQDKDSFPSPPPKVPLRLVGMETSLQSFFAIADVRRIKAV